MDFNVTTADARAADVYSSTHSSFTSMLITAKRSDAQLGELNYLLSTEYVRNSEADSWHSTDGDHYWPAFALDFYAVAASGPNANFDAETHLVDFTVNQDVAQQTDLLVAYTPAVEKPAEDEAVALRFSHALSQVVFDAKCSNPGLHIEIHGLTLCDVVSTATFAFNGATVDASNWSDLKNVTDFRVMCEDEAHHGVSLAPTAIPLTDGYTSRTLMMIPQTAHNAHMLIDCAIYSVSDPARGYQPGVDMQLWGEDDAPEQLMIPLDVEWQPGRRYVYLLGFDDLSTPTSVDDPNSPALKPVEVSITTVPWEEITNELEMQKK